MNGFKLLADSYRKAVADGDVSREDAEKKCKSLDFLATCDQNDFYNMFDSSAFNEITMSYVRRAVRELTDEGTLDEDQAMAVRNRVSTLFSECTAKDIYED